MMKAHVKTGDSMIWYVLLLLQLCLSREVVVVLAGMPYRYTILVLCYLQLAKAAGANKIITTCRQSKCVVVCIVTTSDMIMS